MKEGKVTLFIIIIIINLYKTSFSGQMKLDFKTKNQRRKSFDNFNTKNTKNLDLISFSKNKEENSTIKKKIRNFSKHKNSKDNKLSIPIRDASRSFSKSMRFPLKKKKNSLIISKLELDDIKYNNSEQHDLKRLKTSNREENLDQTEITKDMILSKDLGFDFCLEKEYKILGISPRSSNNNFDPKDKNTKEKSFCSRGKKTCCSYKQMKSTQKYFNRANKILKKNFELVEEILTLFKGENYKNVVEELLKVKDKCDFVVSTTYNFHKASNIEEFLSKKMLNKYLDTVNDLLNELPIYVKGNSEYFGNIMCSLCTQKSHPVHFSENTFNIDLNINSCLNMNEFYIYELRISLLFRKFIITLANLIKCKNDEYNNPEFYINTFDSNLLKEMHTINDKCDDSKTKNIPECNKMCEKKHFMYYKFPFNIFNTAAQTLKILYKEFVDKDIEDFYRNVKNVNNYWDYFTDDPIFFFQKNNMNDKLDLEDFKWNVKNTRGMNIFFEKVGDEYFIVKGSLEIISCLVFVLNLLLY